MLSDTTASADCYEFEMTLAGQPKPADIAI
jgi:hypothetical protein